MNPKPRVLVADDDESALKILNMQLTEAGYDVTLASDGDEAIEFVKTTTFDVALLDVKMPRVVGIQVLKFIKEHSPSTKSIVLTGFADLGMAMDAMEFGAIDFFNKPYSIDDLLLAVKRSTHW